ncbi:hypothetical protein ACIRQQ_45045 [Streptomyces fuscichromogenes]|uniref:hypothetical protein n=1 Tax=Streptomyces fuscichromogenes TaxID=1324013 RepID=UPI00381F56F3
MSTTRTAPAHPPAAPEPAACRRAHTSEGGNGTAGPGSPQSAPGRMSAPGLEPWLSAWLAAGPENPGGPA